MRVDATLTAKLTFLARVVLKGWTHLLDTDQRLFGNLFKAEEARKIRIHRFHRHLDGDAQTA